MDNGYEIQAWYSYGKTSDASTASVRIVPQVTEDVASCVVEWLGATDIVAYDENCNDDPDFTELTLIFITDSELEALPQQVYGLLCRYYSENTLVSEM